MSFVAQISATVNWGERTGKVSQNRLQTNSTKDNDHSTMRNAMFNIKRTCVMKLEDVHRRTTIRSNPTPCRYSLRLSSDFPVCSVVNVSSASPNLAAPGRPMVRSPPMFHILVAEFRHQISPTFSLLHLCRRPDATQKHRCPSGLPNAAETGLPNGA